MHRPQAILFDAFGTLIRSRIPIAEAYQAVGEKHGADLDSSAVAERFAGARKRIFERSERAGQACTESTDRSLWRELINEVFHEVPDCQAIFDDLWQYFADPANWNLYEDVKDCLAEIKDLGIRCSLASNFDERIVGICDAFPELECFEGLFYSTRVGYCKPDPRFFESIASSIEQPPENLLMVGDDLINDYEAALGCKWNAILIDRKDRHDTANSIRSLTELSKLWTS